MLAEGAKFAAPDPEHPFMKDPLSWRTNPIIQEMLFTAGPLFAKKWRLIRALRRVCAII